MDLSVLVKYAPLITAPIFLASALVALFAVRVNVMVNIRNKRADTILHCNNRYDELYKFKLEVKESEDEDRVHAYYARYWGLKSDEFDYWLAGLVDIETFTNWLFVTVMKFDGGTKPIGIKTAQMSFDDGWLKVGYEDNKGTNVWFVDIIKAIRQIGNELDHAHGDGRNAVLLEVVSEIERISAPYRRKMKGEMTVRDLLRVHAKERTAMQGLIDIVKKAR